MSSITRRSFLQTSATAAMALGGAAALGQPGANGRSNFVLLMSDEHNPKVSSIHGHPLVRTPNLERLAARGTVFENTYCPSPLCMPCRSAFMSGRRVNDIQCYNNCNVVPFDYPSYGQVLREQGVHTVHIGKVDVYRPGAELGFSEMLLPGDRKRPGDENICREPLAIRADGASRADGFGPAESNPFAGDDRVVDAALEWLATRPAQLSQPWILVVQVVKPHFPHMVTQELWDRYADGADLPAQGRDVASANHPYARDLRDHFQTDLFTDEQIKGLRRGYLGCVEHVDWELGRIMDALEANGLADTTTLAYTSDHGDMLGKFGMWWKCSLYEDSARVPLVVAGPGFTPGARVRTPVDLHDLRATMFAATGAAQPDSWLGASLQRLEPNDAERCVFSEYHGHGTRSGSYLIRKGDWKLHYCMKAPHQLFNLAEDPEELNNLAEANPGKLRELEEALRAVCSPEEENDRAHAFERRQLAAMAQMKSAAPAT
ncbi:MAG: sulfatase-like hydrolase/transferase [Candidatus Hydrogenedentes bacterium]|nr:sulfatase-like hydrolase/transferase [Candidatus Hydrogenedentota bacterium]